MILWADLTFSAALNQQLSLFMLLMMQVTINVVPVPTRATYFYCQVDVLAIANGTGAAISGAVAAGTFTITPDVDKCTDYQSAFPAIGSLDLANSSPQVMRLRSPNLRSQVKCKRQAYTKTTCTFTLTSLTHPDCTFDPSLGMTAATSPAF
jgi:hypothetical protein